MPNHLRILAGVLVLGALALSGCGLLAPPPVQPKPRTDTVENDLVEFSRTVLTPLKPGQEFTISVKVTAKVDLRVVLISESIPEEFQLAEGSSLRTAQLGLAAGATLEHSYTVRASAKAGSFTITGSAIVATGEGTQEPLALESLIQVRAQ
uniref:Lipoprotein n=1 Tax=Acetithermum autotrophicum TaxID=1446466 RepID=H5ST45_ACEAU|nr:hypothetical protein HGMM_OP3C490 [Candidatus Acetothermum autotrophicum]